MTVSIWSVTNGYVGYGKVACLVEARSAEDAIAVAGPIFEEQERESANLLRRDPSPSYWESLEAVHVNLPYLGDEMP